MAVGTNNRVAGQIMPETEPFRPEAAQQKQALIRARDTLRQQGMDAEIELVVLEATDPWNPKDDEIIHVQHGQGARATTRKDYRREQEKKVRESYAAARAIQQKIDALGEVEAESAEPGG
jgi:hypothetical protein